MSDIVERLRAHKADIWNWNGTAMTAWDSWRNAIAKGDKSSWPRDAFESLIGGYGEDMNEAADTITALRAEVGRLKVEAAAQYADGAHDGSDRAQDLWAGEITALRAENEKLRAALEMFACDCVENDLCKYPHACRNYVARAALEEK